MSKTPRTDAETRLRSGQEVVLVGFARQLETELVEALAEIAKLETIAGEHRKAYFKHKHIMQAQADKLIACDKLIKQMREALDATDEYYLEKSYAGKAHNTPIVVKVREAQAALEAAERSEQ